MIIYEFYCNVLDKSINYYAVGKNLIEILNDIAIKFNIKISIYCMEDIMISTINIHNQSLKMILDDFAKIYDLHYRVENNAVIIEQCEKIWKTYDTKNFYEDILFENNNNKQDKSTNNDNVSWDEIEKTLNKITDNNVVIDKYNCVIHVFGKCNIHNQVKSYIDKINDKKQVVIELQFIEITHDFNKNVNLLNLSTNILDKIAYQTNIIVSINEIIKSISNELVQFGNIDINLSSTMKLLLLSQNKGVIKISNEITLLTSSVTSTGRFSRKQEEKEHKFDEGLFLTIVPLILNDNRVILKLKQALRTFTSNDNNNQFNVNNREITTVMYADLNKPIIIGGLEDSKIVEKKSLFGNMFFLKYLFPNTYKKKKSQIIIIINVKSII